MSISQDPDINSQFAGHAEGKKSQEMLLNMGPQHPSTHGVLRLVLRLDGETIVDCTPVIGYQRIASHLVAVGTYLIDLGAFTPILWTFRDREGIMSLFEALCGSRFNVNYLRVGGVLHDFPNGWLKECEAFLDRLDKNMVELEE